VFPGKHVLTFEEETWFRGNTVELRPVDRNFTQLAVIILKDGETGALSRLEDQGREQDKRELMRELEWWKGEKVG
jgi:hypothetical protein